jgi:hypothetical protein
MLGGIWRLITTVVLISFATSSFGATGGDQKLQFEVIIPDNSFFPSYVWPKVPAYLAVQSAAEWVRFWSVPSRLSLPVPNVGQAGDKTPHIPDPKVDFDQFTLLLITDGPKPYPGYSTTISSVWDGGSYIRVTVINVSPVFDSTCAVTAVGTNPTVVALIPRANKPIVFDVIEATTQFCSGHRTIESGDKQ